MSLPKKIHNGKIVGGIFYLLVGILFLSTHFNFNLLVLQWVLRVLRPFFSDPAIQWCIGWSSIGIGACLINTRTEKASSCFPLHYFGYYGFALFVISLAAYTGGLYGSGEAKTAFTGRFYALSALIGLMGGFLGHRLYELALSSFKR